MDAQPPIIEPATEVPPPQPHSMSLVARLLNVFAIPGEVFAEVKTAVPSVANWLVPTLLLVLAGLLSAWFVYSAEPVQKQMRALAEQAIQKQMDQGKITKEQAEFNRELTRVGLKVAPYLGPVVAAAISPFWWGLIIWLAGNRVFASRFGYWKAVEVAGLANAVAVLERVVSTVLLVGFGAGGGSVSSTTTATGQLALNHPSPALLIAVNVLTFWLLAVRAVGLARLSGAPFMRAAMWIFGVWAAGTCALLGLGLGLQNVFGG